MWFFSRKHKILETPLFEGLKDYHNHTLPAVDDGIKSLDDSLAVLAYLEQLKISEVVLTPHAMIGVNETPEAIEAAFASLQGAYNGPIGLTLASEYMLDYNFSQHLESGPRKVEGAHILVETSYFSAPLNLDELLYEVSSTNLTPLIAHPERYLYMPREDYHALKDLEYNFQLNLLSFSSIYGSRVSQNAIYMLEEGLYSVMGTDLHSLGSFKRRIAEVQLASKHIDMLLDLKTKGL
ncbi:MAG: CpsB/CapC family capsule biosynthesis tyrosine phosphatase [Rikenellaceae bacterium]